MVANEKQLKDVNDVAHPPGMMRGVEAFPHLQRGSSPRKELKNIYCVFTSITSHSYELSLFLLSSMKANVTYEDAHI